MSLHLQKNILYIYTLLRCLIGAICILFFNHITCDSIILLKINIYCIILSSIALTKFNMDFTETILSYLYWFIIEISMLYYLQSCKYTIWYIYPIADLTLFASIMSTYLFIQVYNQYKYSIDIPDLSTPMIEVSPLITSDLYNEI